jgi:DnaJ-class molecular chaperone
MDTTRAIPTGMRTECHRCNGTGDIGRLTAGADRDYLITMITIRECPTCKGVGWIKGFVPPV